MLNFENVNKTFDQHQALKNVSVAFPQQQTTVIVGPSGSGKSTLLRSIDLLEHPESGLYHFDDDTYDFANSFDRNTILKVRRRLGMVFQSYNLFPHLTVLQNIVEGPVHVLKQPKAEATATAEKLLGQVGLSEKANVYPDELSGGQQQRIAIVRMMAMQPEYMLLDEPTSALDPELEVEVLKVILQLAKMKNSLIIVTHNMDFAREVANKIVFVEDGEIRFDGPTAEFFNSDKPRIQAFLQAGKFHATV